MKYFRYPVSMWKDLGYSDERIAMECVKEWLVRQIEIIDHETRQHEELARKAKLPPYIVSIFSNKLKERQEFLNYFLKTILNDLKQYL